MISGHITYRNHSIYYDYIEEKSAADLPPILLLGGVLQNRTSWKSYIRDISPVHKIIAIDLPGIGESKVLNSSYGFDFLADCIYELVCHLKIPKINIFATSYSSVIAYEFSAKYTQFVDKLVISSSMASLPEKQKSIMHSCIDALEKKRHGLFLQNIY